MRTNMDPLTPATSTLSPAISHIAETAASLVASLQDRSLMTDKDGNLDGDGALMRRKKQQDTVRWVVDAPGRLRAMLDAGKVEEAAQDWSEVRRLLEKWEGVGGTKEIMDECETTMSTSTPKQTV